MTKWESLLGGNVETEVSSATPKDFSFVSVAMIVIFVVVLAVFVAASKASSNSNRVDRIANEVGVVMKKTITPEAHIQAPEQAPEHVSEEPKSRPLVRAKFANKSMFDEVTEETTSEYTDFTKTLGRDFGQAERPVSSNALMMHNQLGPMREALKKSGKSLTQFMNENDAYVPDALIDAWDSKLNASAMMGPRVLDDEERIIARDAFQIVSTKASVEETVTVLRDILASRTEASKRGLTLPEMPTEQAESIKFWSKQAGPASKIALSILQKV